MHTYVQHETSITNMRHETPLSPTRDASVANTRHFCHNRSKMEQDAKERLDRMREMLRSSEISKRWGRLARLACLGFLSPQSISMVAIKELMVGCPLARALRTRDTCVANTRHLCYEHETPVLRK